VSVHPVRDVHIHLFRARKRTIAIADDVKVPEVKIGCKPGIGHVPIMKDRLPWRLLFAAEKIAVAAHPGEAAASQNELERCPRSVDL
jgi:hypothetical protein